ncbi:MAG: hypothetical protein Q9208_003527 [Pyrenodesmia sp. 3 TL-2023]
MSELPKEMSPSHLMPKPVSPEEALEYTLDEYGLRVPNKPNRFSGDGCGQEFPGSWSSSEEEDDDDGRHPELRRKSVPSEGSDGVEDKAGSSTVVTPESSTPATPDVIGGQDREAPEDLPGPAISTAQDIDLEAQYHLPKTSTSTTQDPDLEAQHHLPSPPPITTNPTLTSPQTDTADSASFYWQLLFLPPFILWAIIYMAAYNTMGCHPGVSAFMATLPAALAGPYAADTYRVSRARRDGVTATTDEVGYVKAAGVGAGCALFVGWMCGVGMWQAAVDARC